MAIHPDIPGRNRAHFDAIHRGADLHPGGLAGESQRFDHLLLTLGSGAVVGTHRRNKEGLGPVLAQPVPGGLGDGDNVGYSTTPSGDGDFPLGWLPTHSVERAMNLGFNILKGGRDQFLVNLVEIHFS